MDRRSQFGKKSLKEIFSLLQYDKSEKFLVKLNNEEFLVYFSAITETELIAGNECNKFEIKTRILDFLSNFTKVPVDNQIAVKAGDFRRIYGIRIPDAIIAATAYILKATLITRNAKDFEKIKEITIKIPY